MRLKLAILLTVLSLTTTSCKKSSADNGTGDIVIGEYGSMTGSEATFGISTDNGVKLAVEERNNAGGVKGRKIKLIPCYDDQGKPQEAVTAVTRLIQQDHAVAVIGEVASSLSIAGGQVAQRLGVPMISPSSTNAQVTAIGSMISRVCFIDSFQGWAGAKFAHDKGLNKAGLLFNRAQAYSVGLKDDFKKAFTQMGGQVVGEQAYSNGDNDFSAQLTALRDAHPDFIYVPGYYTEVVNIATQARKLGITVPLIGGDGWVSEDLKNAGDALNGCYFTDHYDQKNPAPNVQDFLTKYKAKYGRSPDSMAALGYDAANLLFDAMGRAKSLDGKDLADAINSTKDFKGVTGTITIDADRNARKSAVVQEVKNGTFSTVATIEPPPGK